MKRKLLLAILVIVAVLSTLYICSAEESNNISVYFDGKIIDCSAYGQEPAVIDGRTLVPLRAIFEALGATVEWDQTSKTVASKLDEIEISLTIGEKFLLKNGERKALDVPAQIMNGRTMVPARAISEAFGFDVIWHSDFRIVSIIKYATFVTMYDTNYREKSIQNYFAYKYRKIGWHDNSTEKVTMYTSGGRMAYVSIANIEKYRSNNWSTEPFVWMYADNEKKVEIPHEKIDDYKLVGWYTLDEYISYQIYLGKEEKAIGFINSYAYNTISIDTANKMLNNIYEQTGIPFVAYDWNISENSIGTPKANIYLKNLTNKEIVSFEIAFTCYDAYGEETYDYGSATKTAFSDRDKVKPYNSFGTTLTLYGNERTYRINKPQVIRVAFSDGTVWSR